MHLRSSSNKGLTTQPSSTIPAHTLTKQFLNLCTSHGQLDCSGCEIKAKGLLVHEFRASGYQLGESAGVI